MESNPNLNLVKSKRHEYMLGIVTKRPCLEFSGIARIWKDFKDFAKKGAV